MTKHVEHIVNIPAKSRAFVLTSLALSVSDGVVSARPDLRRSHR
jgi:hypothetical protein